MKLTNILKKEYETISSETIFELTKNQSPNIQKIFSLWEKTYHKYKDFIPPMKEDASLYKRIYEEIVENQKDIHYSPEDITQVSIFLKKYERENIFSTAGSLLSALVNYHRLRHIVHYQKIDYETDLSEQKNEYQLITEHLEVGIMHIGMKNHAKIKIIGDVGGNQFNTGTAMKGGEIYILGNCINHLGFAMKNGNIIVEKDVIDGSVGTFMLGGIIEIKGTHFGNDVGHTMRGGKIIIHGMVKGIVGNDMTGGEIYINDETTHISRQRKGGKIYCNGRRVS